MELRRKHHKTKEQPQHGIKKMKKVCMGVREMPGSLLEDYAKENLPLLTDCSVEGMSTKSYWTA